MWAQGYDPFGNAIVSTAMAAVPVVVLLGCIAFLKMKAHVAALLGIASSLAIAILAFGMPTGMATRAAAFGAAYGLMPIGWIILNVIFLYRLTEQRGQFRILQDSIASITPDRRLQLLLIAFGFGAFFEGAA
ncbi:MAG TPA: L-lactate permease, partial [Steroidobacter sp.]